MTEAARTFTPSVSGVSPDLHDRTHYGVKDAGAGQDDLRLRVGDGVSRSGDTPVRGTGDAEETSVAGDRGRPANTSAENINLQSMVALVLSVLGVTAPIGVFLAYSSLRTIHRTGELGTPFAVVAKWLGWLWIAFFAFGFIAYFWIGSQGG